MRIGADSIDYSNSGQEVRSQVTQLRDATNITKVIYQSNYLKFSSLVIIFHPNHYD